MPAIGRVGRPSCGHITKERQVTAHTLRSRLLALRIECNRGLELRRLWDGGMQAMRGARRGDHTLSSPRMVAYSTILVASFVPPVYLLVRSFMRRDVGDAVVAVVAGVLYLVMLSRLWDVASVQRGAMVRSRTLRRAAAALAAATSTEDIAAAVQHAATALVSQPEPGSRERVTALLAVRRDSRLRAG